jgi:hypothetical protein
MLLDRLRDLDLIPAFRTPEDVSRHQLFSSQIGDRE